ncbi:MAG: hypothetical protein DRI34_10430 [Deltaproteobacteria bacterium]|nr:MAG: hypothetical protein DRI34_10430 [Deltaproteobacteria bacterium]
MRLVWHDIWGCARGPVMRLAPRTRLLAGAGLFVSCLTLPVLERYGWLLLVGLVLSWLLLCRPPARMLLRTTLLGLVLLLPYFLLLPLLPSSAGTGWRALSVPTRVFLHGMSGLLVSVTTVMALTASDLREALVRLPLPRLVVAILLQIVQQTSKLLYESGRMAAAMSVRGASRGPTAAWRILFSLPRSWLPRVLDRSDRVAAAMEVRGYDQAGVRPMLPMKQRVGDLLLLLAVMLVLVLAVYLRLETGR